MTDALTPDELAFLQGLFDLAREGRTADLLQALDAGVPVDLTNSAGDTLLILAAYHQHLPTVVALLGCGADTERVNDRGQTSLGGAVFRQDEGVVRALLAAGADPDGGGRTARELAAFFELPAMAALLDAPRVEASGRTPGQPTGRMSG